MLLFDIGANIGRWAIANSSNTTRIISVEASPHTFNKLKHNVVSFANITPLNIAVSSESSDSVTFYHCTHADTISTLDRRWLSANESRFGNYRNAIQEIKIGATTLDALIAEYGVPDLLKIDVEGAENIVLRSLKQKVPMVCFEWAAEWMSEIQECIDILSALGFTQFAIQMEDNYTYRPSDFPFTVDSLRERMRQYKPKQDWGMIWAI